MKKERQVGKGSCSALSLLKTERVKGQKPSRRHHGNPRNDFRLVFFSWFWFSKKVQAVVSLSYKETEDAGGMLFLPQHSSALTCLFREVLAEKSRGARFMRR